MQAKRKRKRILTVLIMLLCTALFVSLSANAISIIVDRIPEKEENGTSAISAFEGAYISFLGDSITTYNGYSNNTTMNSTIGNNDTYYNASKMPVKDTYWMRVIDTLGMTLCVNNSWNAGRVTDTKQGITSGVERANQLHNDRKNVKPYYVIVYMGTNDVANGVELSLFESAYEEMLGNIKTNYPKAKVYCCTILPESRTANKSSEVTSYNAAIRSMAKAKGYGVVDFARDISSWNYNSLTFVDDDLRVHPTSSGMEKLSKCIIDTLLGDLK